MNEQLSQIAVVDDDDAVRIALVRLLRSASMDARAFASGIAFIESLSTSTPICVILDLHMPGLSGMEVQTRLAQSWPSIPVIIVTGNHAEATYADVMRLHPVAYLLKPVDSALLFEAVYSALQRCCPGHLHR